MNRTTDWYDVNSVGARDFRVTERLETVSSNVYLLAGSDDSLVVDAGLGIGDLRGMAEEFVDTDTRLLLTHTHWDHIGAGHQFDRVSVHPAECTEDRQVRIDSLSDEFVGRPAQFVETHREAGGSLPDDFDADPFTILPMTDVEPVESGETIDLGDRTLELVGLAGHSPGQLGVLDREQGVLHGGDVVHGDKNLYVHFRHADIDDYVDTFDRVIDLRDSGAFDTLTTGHNPPMSGDELAILDDLRAGLAEISAGERTPETVDTSWGQAHRYLIDDSEVLTKTSV